MLSDYAEAAGQEVWNQQRLQAYLTNVGSPFDSGPSICACDTLTPGNLGSTDAEGDPIVAYTTPNDPTQPAPWYDVDLPVSGEFLGFMPLSVDGTTNNPLARTVSNAVGGGGVFGPSRALPRTITVTGILIGTSCCGADYGMHYLSEVLAGCSGDSCDGDCFEMFDCCPSTVLTEAQLNDQHRRTFRRTALVSGPTETSRTARGECSTGACSGGEIIQIEFVLVAATPWAWTDPLPILDVPLPASGTGDCIEWCSNTIADECIGWDLSGAGGCVWDFSGPNPCLEVAELSECEAGDCIHAACTPAQDACADPLFPVPTPPQPTSPTAPFCTPLAPERECYTIDLSTRPAWSSDVPIITVSAGAADLRNVRITFYERPTGTMQTCDEIADDNRCAPFSDFYVTFVPAGGSVVIDGQTGRATTNCAGECNTASTVYGSADGGPLVIDELTCAEYCVCIESDPLFPPDPEATVAISVSGRGY